MRIEEIKYKHIIGYSIFCIHTLIIAFLNVGWLVITNVIYLHILLFSQLSVLLSWRVFDGKCIISTLENYILDHDDEFDSLTTRVVSNYLPENVGENILRISLIVAALITLLKIAYTKMNTITIDDLYL